MRVGAFEQKQIIEENKTTVTDKFKLEEHMNILRTLKDELFIYNKVLTSETGSFSLVNFGTTYHKLQLVLKLEKEMKINRLQIDAKINEITFYEIPDKLYNLFKKTFRITRPKPKNTNDLFKMYISMLKNITCSEFVTTIRLGKNNIATYKLNNDLIRNHLDLDKHANPNLLNYDKDLLLKIGYDAKKQDVIFNDDFIDD